MSLSSDAPQDAEKVEARGKVLKFPVTPATAKKSWPSLKKYRLVATAIAVLAVGGIVVGLSSFGGGNPLQYNTAPVTRGDISKIVTATGTVKVGDKATFTVDAFPQRLFQGAVTQVRQSPHTVQNLVTYDVVVGVDNNDLALVPGMTAPTRVVIDQRSNVTRVPDQALRYTPGGLSGVAAVGALAAGQARVWVLRDGTPVAIPVVPGLDDGNYTEIVKGDFQPSDRVITAESHGQASGQSGLPTPRL
jgi:hypothetical protein